MLKCQSNRHLMVFPHFFYTLRLPHHITFSLSHHEKILRMRTFVECHYFFNSWWYNFGNGFLCCLRLSMRRWQMFPSQACTMRMSRFLADACLGGSKCSYCIILFKPSIFIFLRCKIRSTYKVLSARSYETLSCRCM